MKTEIYYSDLNEKKLKSVKMSFELVCKFNLDDVDSSLVVLKRVNSVTKLLNLIVFCNNRFYNTIFFEKKLHELKDSLSFKFDHNDLILRTNSGYWVQMSEVSEHLRIFCEENIDLFLPEPPVLK